MNRRTFEGPMDWEYQNQPPVDMSSPFAKLSQQRPPTSFDSPFKFGRQHPNPFAAAGAKSSPLKPSSSQQQPESPPPHTSYFNPQVPRPSAPSFRNPAFTTPQKRIDELQFSEMSGAESSPAMTDTSEMPPDTPDVDRDDDYGMTITQHTANRALFSKSAVRSRTPGRGEVPRGNRDKVRKRKRLQGDRDVGSVRPRLPHESDESDSDVDGASQDRRAGGKKGPRQGWFGGFLTAIGNHPSAPTILARWLQLSINLLLVGVLLWVGLAVLNTVRSDLAHATEKARSELLNQMSQCKDHYQVNRCFPKAERLPAIAEDCERWEACMNQDQDAVMRIQVSAKNFAEVLNEFVGVISVKAWVFVISLFGVMVLANNVGFGHLRDSHMHEPIKPAPAFPSQPAGGPPHMLTSPQHDPHQAYIWAPISQTPRHIRRDLLAADTDTDNSPPHFRAIMPPQTPSRRSPSKGDRGRSPTKANRSPSKGY
ncbi:hypothetical protein GQ53DRAFT_786299 [Thozetella sp. PMI_491]|nr:hypothetical protein GQ53DRAFT_786299 [Thozetella sp. PMI_491]